MSTDPSRIQVYGIDALLTGEDDPALWEAALLRYWPAPQSPDCLVDALRFDTGRRLADGELPQGEQNQQHASMRGMVDIEEWCFERVDDARLRIKTCPPPSATTPALFMSMSLTTMMAGLGSGQAPPPPVQVVFMYLGISRPSRDAAQAVVFAGSTAPGLADGAAYLWQRDEQGRWEQTDQCVTRWIS